LDIWTYVSVGLGIGSIVATIVVATLVYKLQKKENKSNDAILRKINEITNNRTLQQKSDLVTFSKEEAIYVENIIVQLKDIIIDDERGMNKDILDQITTSENILSNVLDNDDEEDEDDSNNNNKTSTNNKNIRRGQLKGGSNIHNNNNNNNINKSCKPQCKCLNCLKGAAITFEKEHIDTAEAIKQFNSIEKKQQQLLIGAGSISSTTRPAANAVDYNNFFGFSKYSGIKNLLKMFGIN
jgi:hypothetical protein